MRSVKHTLHLTGPKFFINHDFKIGLEGPGAEALNRRQCNRPGKEKRKALRVERYHRERDAAPEGFRDNARKERAQFLGDPTIREKRHETADMFRQKSRAERRYFCELCEYTGGVQDDYDKHIGTKKHNDKLEGKGPRASTTPGSIRKARYKAEKKFYCATCDWATDRPNRLESHMESTRHQKKAQKEKEA